LSEGGAGLIVITGEAPSSAPVFLIAYFASIPVIVGCLIVRNWLRPYELGKDATHEDLERQKHERQE